MRARLLDMGEVSAARSQSIYHAVAAAMGPGDSPVAIVHRVASTMVSIGVDHHPHLEIDLEFCLANRIPVLRRLLGGAAQLVGSNQLLFEFLSSADGSAGRTGATPAPLVGTCSALGLPARIGPSGEVLLGAAEDETRQVGSIQTGDVENASCLVAGLSLHPASLRRDAVLRIAEGNEGGETPATSLAEELEERPDFATVAETLLVEVEKSLEVELVPSMPTPDEMDAIYEWDERLVFDLESAIENVRSEDDRLAC